MPNLSPHEPAMSDGTSARRPYHSPELSFHGRFGEITRQEPEKQPAEIPDNFNDPVYLCPCPDISPI